MFRNDYSETAPGGVLEALLRAQDEQNYGYGLDGHTQRAKELIRDCFNMPKADIHFIAGGTQTNMTVISYLLRPYEAVIACDTAHINVHETGAVEASGHKVITCPNCDGKLLACDIDKVMALHTDEHMVKPRMVYISDATESGTVYTCDELLALREACDRHGLLLFMDGARLGTALTCKMPEKADAALIGRVCDVFYIGGTKNGLLFGEAVVFRDSGLSADFRYHIKNRGAMLAKGFVAGIQFETLFADELFFRLAQHSNDMADIIRAGLIELGVTLEGTSPTNQIFLRLPCGAASELMERFGCELWTDDGDEKVIRVVTSFATKENECRELLDAVRQLV